MALGARDTMRSGQTASMNGSDDSRQRLPISAQELMAVIRDENFALCRIYVGLKNNKRPIAARAENLLFIAERIKDLAGRCYASGEDV